jgi:hypothetical protein
MWAVRSFPGDFLIEPSANRPSQKCHYWRRLADFPTSAGNGAICEVAAHAQSSLSS